MAQTISGFFRARSEGQAAQNALLANGFSRDQVSFVAGDAAAHEQPAIGPVLSGTESEAAADAFYGGMAGMAAGLVAMAIPGFGALVAAGPMAGAIAGMAVGAAAGGVVGLLRDHGVTEEEAEFIAEGVRKGGALVTVQNLDDDQAKLARNILDQNGAIDVEKLPEDTGEYRKAS
jgi:hypothetical protein